MVIDTSALIAILLDEPDGSRIYQAIRSASRPGHRFISAPTMLEAYTVIFSRARGQGVKDLEQLCGKMAIRVQGFYGNMLPIALNAWMEYGKSTGHPARLNYGDCFSYALAKHRDDALLCKGDDFRHTDIKLADY